jgi:hypothetical protein
MMPKSTAKSRKVVGRDKFFLLNAPEASFFIAVSVMINQLRGLGSAFQTGKIAKGAFMLKFNTVLAGLTETVATTERFDIVMPVMDYGQFSSCFWRWFNWWDDYFKELTPMQVEQIERLGRERDSTLRDYRPRDHWLSCRHTPAFILVLT